MVLVERSVEISKGKFHMHQQCIPYIFSDLPGAENALLQSAEKNGFRFEVHALYGNCLVIKC
jgi:hypothetical protein